MKETVFSAICRDSNFLCVCTYNKNLQDFLGGPVVKNLPSNAGDTGLICGWGTKIPHAAGQLSPRATTTEPVHSRARKPQLERSPCAAMKSPRITTKDSTCCNKDPACHK